MYLIFFLYAVILLGPLDLTAQEDSLGEIVVHPTPPSQPLPDFDTTLSTSVIEGESLQGKRTAVSEVLSEIQGVQIRRYGGLDDFATVTIRGSTSEQVAIFLDGILLNPAVGGGVNLATIPTEQIEKIEVYRGSAPARFGTSAMGGAIVIRTKKARDERKTRLTTSYGSFNTLQTSLFQGQGLKPFAYTADYHFARSDGDFSFPDDNGTPFNSSDDRFETRKNNEFSKHNLALQFERPLWKGSFGIQETFFREDRGVPGLGTLTSEFADLTTTSSATRMEWKRRNLAVAPFFQFQNQQFKDLEGEIGLGRQDNDNDTYRYGLDQTSEFLVGRHQRLTLSVGYRGEHFSPEDLLSDTREPASIRHNGVLGLEDEVLLWGEKIVFNPSIRTEHVFNDFEDVRSSLHPVSGKLGIRYTPISWATVRTNFARAYRLPNFSELFGDRGNLLGNSALNPEKGWNWDTGLAVQAGVFKFETFYFLNHASDLIQFLQTSQLTARAENLQSARLQGVETYLSFPIIDPIEFSGNYTFQWATNTSGLPGIDGKFLPGRPRHEATGKLTFHYRWMRIHGDLTYIDDNFLDSQNLLKVNNRVLMGAGLSFTPIKWLTTSFDAKNLLNDRIFDVVGFPLPGRSFYGKVEISI